MVGNMNSPEQPAVMINPVFKIKSKVFQNEQSKPVEKIF
jgi:hypothetical protein